MKIVNKILLSLALVLGIASCQREPLANFEGDKVRIEVDASELSFGTQNIDTRSTEASDMEKRIQNAYAYVFDRDGDLCQRAEGFVDSSTGKCVFEFESQDGVLTLAVLANVTESVVVNSEVEDNFTLEEFRKVLELMPFSGNDQVLSWYFPLKTAEIELPNGLSDAITDLPTLKFEFAYARIDARVSGGGSLLYYFGRNIPKQPYVVPSSAFMTQGSSSAVYLYPTVLDNTQNNAVSLILYIKATGAASYTYYKLVMRYDKNGSDCYDIEAGTRYLVDIKSISTPGYSDLNEAISAPPANIDYDIVVDGNSSSIVDNGQYYVGSSAGYWAEFGVTDNSHMINTGYALVDIDAQDPSNGWSYEDGSLTLDFEFDYNVGENSNILISNIKTKSITVPEGVEIIQDAGDGYNTTTNENSTSDWRYKFGKKKLKLKVSSDFQSGDVVIKFGELQKSIPLDVRILTDYSDVAMVNSLVGSSGNGRPNSTVNSLRLSNCYILTQDATNVTAFYIPIAERINEYWNDYGEDASLTIKESELSDYDVEVLWSDQIRDPINDLGVEIEKALSPTGKSAIKVILPPSATNCEGNILVAVKKGDTIVWSWHLWITDYNPYNGGTTYTIDSDRNGTMLTWLDRNVGALHDRYVNYGGCLYYQWGRKDPIRGKKSYSEDPIVKTIFASLEQIYNATPNIAASVKAPDKFYFVDGGLSSINFDWCGTDTDWDQDRGYHWRDKKMATVNPGDSDYNSNKVYGDQKSIFDPSPLGFMVPCSLSQSTYVSPFTFIGLYKAETSTDRIWDDTAKGLRYIGDESTPLFFPACGFRNKFNAYLSNLGFTSGTYYGLASPDASNDNKVRYFSFSYQTYVEDPSRTSAADQVSGHQSNGYPVRSIKELE